MSLFLIKFLTAMSLSALLFCCNSTNKAASVATNAKKQKNSGKIQRAPRWAQLVIPNGKRIEVELAITIAEQQQGLSGRKSKDYPSNQAMLFFYFNDEKRRFWMPDTYFDLDIFFLDENLKVIDVDRKVTHHPGWNEPPEIVRTRNIKCRHVLELRADSSFSKAIKKGDILKWKSSLSLSEIKSKIHLELYNRDVP